MKKERNIIGYVNIQCIKKRPLYDYDKYKDFGVVPIFINEDGAIQIDGCNFGIVAKNYRNVYYLCNGRLQCFGKITEWSKKPITNKLNKVQEYKKITQEIEELKEKRRSLLF